MIIEKLKMEKKNERFNEKRSLKNLIKQVFKVITNLQIVDTYS